MKSQTCALRYVFQQLTALKVFHNKDDFHLLQGVALVDPHNVRVVEGLEVFDFAEDHIDLMCATDAFSFHDFDGHQLTSRLVLSQRHPSESPFSQDPHSFILPKTTIGIEVLTCIEPGLYLY